MDRGADICSDHHLVIAKIEIKLRRLVDPTPSSMEWWERMKAAMMAAGKDVFGYQKSLKESWNSNHMWGLTVQMKLLQQK